MMATEYARLRSRYRDDEPLTVEDVRIWAYRNRTGMPGSTKNWDMKVLALVEALEEQVIRHGYSV